MATAEQEGIAPQRSTWRDRVAKSAMWGTIACGAGLFSDGYLNASIGPVNTMLSRIYGSPYSGSKKIVNVSAIAFAGTVVGQIFFGFTSDHWSRKGSLMVSTVILIVFAILSAGAWGKNLEIFINTLIAFRFFVGIGIGGEYPAGSVGAAENSGSLKKGTRNRWFILFTNNMIDLGWVLAYLVAMIVVLCTGDGHLRAAWRICLAIGAIPPISLFFLRTLISEPEPFTHEKMTLKNTPWWLAFRFYWFRWLLVAIIWFIYDFCAYSFGNFSSVLVDNLFTAKGGYQSDGKTKTLWISLGWSTLLNLFYMPGAIGGAFLADTRIGPKYTLILGTGLQAIFGFGMAAGARYLYQINHVAGYCIVYGLFLAFGELGPGDNIGLFAAKTCSTSIRGKYYGLAAAVGKIGAFTGQYAFTAIQNRAPPDDLVLQTQYPFWLGGGLALFSCFIALLLPNINQDVVADEDIRFREFLEKHGYDTSTMGIPGASVVPLDIATGEEKYAGKEFEKSGTGATTGAQY